MGAQFMDFAKGELFVSWLFLVECMAGGECKRWARDLAFDIYN